MPDALANVTESANDAISRRRLPPTWMLFCALGTVGAVIAVVATRSGVRIGTLAMVATITVSTMLVKGNRGGRGSRAVWNSFAAGSTFLVGATLIGSHLWSKDLRHATSIFLGIQMAGFALLFAGFVGSAQVKKTMRDLDSVLDAMILGLAFGLFAWRSVFYNAVSDARIGTAQIFAVSLLPAVDILTGTLLLRRAFAARRTSPAYRMIMVAAACATGAHITSGVSVLRESSLTNHVPFQIALLCLLAAAMTHPTRDTITSHDEPAPHKFGATRIALLALALLDPPIVMLMDYQRPDRTSSALLIGAVGMSVIVIVRLITLAREMERTRARERVREQRFESLVQNSTDLIVLLDRRLHMTYLSPAVQEMLGFAPADVIGLSVAQAFHRDDAERTIRALHELEPGATSELELVRIRHRTHGWRWVEVRAVNRVDDPTVGGIVINCRDVTERIAAEALLFDTNAQQGAVARLGRDALTAPDVTSLMTNAASLVRSTLEVKSCSVLLFEGREIRDIVVARAHGNEVIAFEGPSDQRIVSACLEADEPLQFIDPDPDGDLVTTQDLVFTSFSDTQIRLDDVGSAKGASHVMAVQLVDRDQVIGALVVRSGRPRTFTTSQAGFLDTMGGTLGLALARRRTEASASHSALHDQLTGLPNRTLFVDRLTQAINRAARSGGSLAVLFLDIDHFKVINDSLGHSAGDQILTEVANRLASLVRPQDTVARFGGDEFTILLDALAGRGEAQDIAERIRLEVSRPIAVGSTGIQPTISIGVAFATRTGSDAESLLRDADAAMYQAKELGRNNVAFFDDTMRDRVIHRLRTEVDLPHAIMAGQLVLYYQPVIDLAVGSIVGMEALVRWQHPTLGLLPPGQFIPVAEQSGLIGDLDLWVMHEVMLQSARWSSTLGDAAPWCALNVSARTIANPDLPWVVSRVLTETGSTPEKICFEITESALMNDVERSIEALHSLRERGVSLAVDDFGTGYSSLTYLKRLPVNNLKIDASFVAGLDREGTDHAIIEAVVALATTLGQAAIAEGVEHPRQLDVLTELGCQMAQGYLLGRPVPVDEVDFQARPMSRSRLGSERSDAHGGDQPTDGTP